jgi:hypothetical protein
MKRAVVAEMLRWSDEASSIFWIPLSRASRLGIAPSLSETGGPAGGACANPAKQNMPAKQTACTCREHFIRDVSISSPHHSMRTARIINDSIFTLALTWERLAPDKNICQAYFQIFKNPAFFMRRIFPVTLL